MRTDNIKKILLKELSLEDVHVFLERDCYQIIAVDRRFTKMSKLDQHKLIYAPLVSYILNNEIHSVSIKTFDPEEWKIQSLLYKL